MLPELKSRYPYRIDGKYLYHDFDISLAKQYFRILGFEVGKDVKYGKDKKGFLYMFKRDKGEVTHFQETHELSPGEFTPITDLYYLDRITNYINHIMDGDPIWTSIDRVPIVQKVVLSKDR